MLTKRAIENYVPQEALEAWAGKPENADYRRTIALLGRLSRAQRDHLPKNGFPSERGVVKAPRDSGTLYDDLSEEEQELLTWNPRRIKPFEEALADHQNAIATETLRERCGPEGSDERYELDQLLAQIARLL